MAVIRALMEGKPQTMKQSKKVAIRGKALKELGYDVKLKKQEGRLTIYNVISPSGEVVLQVTKRANVTGVVAMARDRYLFCDRVVIKAEEGEVVLVCKVNGKTVHLK